MTGTNDRILTQGQDFLPIILQSVRVGDFSAAHGAGKKRIADDGRSVLAMLASARLNDAVKNKLRAEAKSTATKMKNLWITKRGDLSAYEQFYGKPSILQPHHWIEFGRIGYVTDNTKIKGKLKDKAFPCVMLGYAGTQGHTTE